MSYITTHEKRQCINRSNIVDRMASNRSLLLVGIGDGGGGPHLSHLEQLDRLKLSKGLPRIHTDIRPDIFFDEISEDFSCRRAKGYPPPPKWVGELYLELHQGSLTSQAHIKKQNRNCECQLRGLDALLVYCWKICASQKLHVDDNWQWLVDATTECRGLWKDLLLNQFHDVLRKYFLIFAFSFKILN